MKKDSKATDLFFNILKKNGINKIFGNPGTTELSLLNAVKDHPDFEYILALQESTAVGMAAGYSSGTGKVAFVNLHTFCGLANGMCNIFNALHSQIPLIITAGQQHRKMLSFNPTLSGPLTDLAKSAVKNIYEVCHSYDLGLFLQRSINISNLYPKGPTFLSLPLDIFHENITYHHDIGFPPPLSIGSISINEFKSLVSEINLENKKICIILDQESKDAYYELIQLAENLAAEVYNSSYVNFQVFDTSHYLYKGTIPSSFKDQNKLLSKYEIAFVIGKKLCCFLPSEANPIPQKCKIVHINNSLDEMNYNFRTDFSFVGDIPKSIINLNKALSELRITAQNKPKLHSKREEHDKKCKEKERLLLKEIEEDKEKFLNPKGVIYYALKVFPEKYSLVIEPSSEMNFFSNLVERKTPNTIFYAHRGAGLGWAMPFSIGLSMAKKEPVLCFIGDGGSLYAIQSIYSALLQKTPVIS